MDNKKVDVRRQIKDILQESALVKKAIADKYSDLIGAIAELIINAYRNGGKVVLFGNGGSASAAQHIAAELVGQFLIDRQPLPAIALNTNTSILTAIANDYGFDLVFARQVEAMVRSVDVVIGISTSGNSPNVVDAIRVAKEKGAKTVGLTGITGGRLATIAELTLTVPSNSIPRIQEAHITIGHIICEIVEKELAEVM